MPINYPFYFKIAIEIVILWFVFYRILVFFEGTRAFQVFRGIIVLVLAFFIFQKFQLNTLNWILTKLFTISVIGLFIIFQPELRQGLARLGEHHIFNIALEEKEILKIIQEVGTSLYRLSSKKTGALIAFERENKLPMHIESGIPLDAQVTQEIIQSIFNPVSPLHDGGVIISRGRIAAAACLFPLSESPHFDKSFGTRHRAAIGLSEQTDAVVLMVSEETANISLAINGKFVSFSSQEELENILKNLLIKHKKSDKVS